MKGLTRSWKQRWKFWRGASSAELDAKRAELVRMAPAPTFWLFGKTGSGKSSLVRLLTGSLDISIGAGFRPTTQRTDLYSFPDAELPVMHFLDTRGIGEAGYDARQDIDALQQVADAVIVTQRLLDFATDSVVQPLSTIRKAAPPRPVLLVVTCLHEAYPGQQHPPYPFNDSLSPEGVSPAVARPLEAQREAFSGLFDAIIPVDITRPGEGFAEPEYGGSQFVETLTGLLPASYQQSMRGMAQLMEELKDLHEQAALPYIHSSAMLAATAALAPVPWVDIPVVAAIQTRMVYAIAGIYQQQGSMQRLLEMFAAAGIGFAARLGVRELLKFIPYVGTIAGGVLGAAMAYSYTYAIGKVSCWYHSRVQAGHEPTQQEIRSAFESHWNKGREIWKAMRQTQA